MILHEDPRDEYCYQLTEDSPNLKEIEFALDPFRDNKENHCIIRMNNKQQFAVFTKGEKAFQSKEERLEALEAMKAAEYIVVE